MSLTADIQTLEPGAIVNLLEVDFTEIGGPIQRFHPHQQEAPIWFQGQQYHPWPMEVEGFARTGQSQPQPTLTLGNVNGTITALCMTYEDCVGAVVTRRQTLRKYLDAENFPGGNPEADPTQEFQPEIWIVDRKSYEDRDKVQFELASAFDLEGQQLPGRVIVSGRCLWLSIGGYRGEYCGYAGPPVATYNDTPTSDPALDRCGGRVVSCKLRFGEHEQLMFGSFPASGMAR